MDNPYESPEESLSPPETEEELVDKKASIKSYLIYAIGVPLISSVLAIATGDPIRWEPDYDPELNFSMPTILELIFLFILVVSTLVGLIMNVTLLPFHAAVRFVAFFLYLPFIVICMAFLMRMTHVVCSFFYNL